MSENKRVYVYMDGSNFYWNLKETGFANMNFKFKEFIDSLVGDRKLEGIRYYIVSSGKSQKLHKKQQILFEKLKKAGIYIVRGKIRQIGKIFTEKGVDVRIAIDLIEGAYENRYDEAILISSDGDLTRLSKW